MTHNETMEISVCDETSKSHAAYNFGSNHDIFRQYDDLYQHDDNGRSSGFGQDACSDNE
ncbi:hypothetical protein J28TS4_50790 [Paenibacillus lautus]|nr:hypothetical protein J28TS4_50790 [Paenibacillus lautus]